MTKPEDIKLKTIRPAAPEDLRVGMFITVTHTRTPVVPAACELMAGHEVAATRLSYIPPDAGLPLKVVGVCLPFVLAIEPGGNHRTLDTRRQHLTRLPKAYGRLAFAKLAGNRTE